MSKSEEAAIRQAAAWEFMARRAELARDKALARAEAAEAKLDEQIEAAIALRHDLDTLRDLYGAAEARIAAALEEHTPFGPVGMACPTCRSGVKYDGLGRCPTRAALVEPVGEPPRPAANFDAVSSTLTVGDPQPPTCAECQDERWVCDRFGHGLCRDPRCVVNRRPCPSCAPTESDPT